MISPLDYEILDIDEARAWERKQGNSYRTCRRELAKDFVINKNLLR